MNVERPAFGGHGRVGEVLGDDVEVADRGDLGSGSRRARLGWPQDRAVPAGQEPDRQHRQRQAADQERRSQHEAATAKVQLARRESVHGKFEQHRVDGEEDAPLDGSGQALVEAEHAVTGQRQQHQGDHCPARGGQEQGEVGDPGPPVSEPRVERAERGQSRHHREDQARLFDHLARMLQGVDEEAEEMAGHEVEDRPLEQLGQRPEPCQQGQQVHGRDQRQSGGAAGNHTLPPGPAQHASDPSRNIAVD